MAFTEQEKRAAWNKAREVDGYDKNMFRKDACGAWIAWSKYGARDNDYGWEIDHIYPVERGGDNHPENLQTVTLIWKSVVHVICDVPFTTQPSTFVIGILSLLNTLPKNVLKVSTIMLPCPMP